MAECSPSSTSVPHKQWAKLENEHHELASAIDATRAKKTDVAQKDFQGPWPVTGQPTADGLLPVKVKDETACVRVYAVETDKVITTSSDCNAVVAANQPKSAATRGVGEDCKKK